MCLRNALMFKSTFKVSIITSKSLSWFISLCIHRYMYVYVCIVYILIIVGWNTVLLLFKPQFPQHTLIYVDVFVMIFLFKCGSFTRASRIQPDQLWVWVATIPRDLQSFLFRVLEHAADSAEGRPRARRRFCNVCGFWTSPKRRSWWQMARKGLQLQSRSWSARTVGGMPSCGTRSPTTAQAKSSMKMASARITSEIGALWGDGSANALEEECLPTCVQWSLPMDTAVSWAAHGPFYVSEGTARLLSPVAEIPCLASGR